MSGREAVLAALDVSRETSERLDIYAALLDRWSPRINLVSPKTLPQLWERHILDSAQLFTLAKGERWVDLGSGGGFPGLVLAILAAAAKPDVHMTLVEADQRKATFLRTVLRETGIPGDVICDRIEKVPPLGAESLTARALAPLRDLLAYAERHLAPGGRALYMKGRGARDEVQDALARWRFDCQTYPSRTDPEAVILSIGDIERV